jgi:hypothetical protein
MNQINIITTTGEFTANVKIREKCTILEIVDTASSSNISFAGVSIEFLEKTAEKLLQAAQELRKQTGGTD